MSSDVPSKLAPTPSLRRMPGYLRYLHSLQQADVAWVSCTVLAERLQKDPTLVRKDLALTGVTGRPKLGYDVRTLIAAIESFIGWDNPEDAFLVGIGSLGTALLGYSGFSQHGLNIVAGFDVDPEKVGTEIRGKVILHLDRLLGLAQRMHIGIGIIAVDAPQAQHVADLMVDGGIRGIWNFAPARLRVPARVIVENEDLSASLAVLSRRLARATIDRSALRSQS